MKKITLFVIAFYKGLISKALVLLLGHSCRFEPTCSEYAYQAVNKYGIIHGLVLAVKRVLKCNPLVAPGYDPVK